MFASELRIALRFLRKQLSFSIINIAGLAIGMACAILIMLYVADELSFDRYHENADRIYRVVKHEPGNVYLGSDHFAVTQAILGPTLKADYPEVLESVTIQRSGTVLLSAGTRSFVEEQMIWATPALFDMFSFQLLHGDPETALAEPYSILLTEAFAEKYFPGENPIGRIIRYNDQHDFKVTGILQEIPSNSHFHFDILGSFESLIAMSSNKDQFYQWGNSSYHTYILVTNDFDPAALEAKFPAFVERHFADQLRQWGRSDDNLTRYYLQPLTSIHLHSRINFDIGRNNDIRYIYMLSGLALVILALACINYINLTTARAALRAREVGMRKVVGAMRIQLVRQFIGESLLLVSLAGMVALLLVGLLLPIFSDVVEREISWQQLATPANGLLFLLFIIVVGVIAGSYPAFFLARFQPVKTLKGAMLESRPARPRLRNILVILQFTASIALIIATLAMHKQLLFIKNKKLGYDREHVVVMRLRDSALRDKASLIKQQLQQHSRVLGVTISGHLPTYMGSQTGLQWTGESKETRLSAYNTSVDYDYLEVFQIELVEGRNFSPQFATDSAHAYIINETLRDALGWDQAVGKPFGRNQVDGTVIGVIRDFHMHSMRQEIQPLFLYLGGRWISHISVRIQPQAISETLDDLRRTWEAFGSKYPFDYFFLDDEFNRLYKSEEKLSALFGYFTLLAIFIACLGLFGLASFSAQQKTKEIGIRKVLGAGLPSLWLLLSKDFARPVLMANLLAWPLAYLAVRQWLQGFAYRTELGWELFVLTGLVATAIALLTVSSLVIRAASTNPVEALKYE